MRIYIFSIVLLASLSTFGQSALPTGETLAKTENSSSNTPPTLEELAPLRSEYLAELAKIHEPPELALKSMRVRKPVSTTTTRLFSAMSASASPDRATHEQRANEIKELLKIVGDIEPTNSSDRAMTYGLIAVISCYDGASPETVIGYANRAGDDDMALLALRAKMYLRSGDKKRSVDDLEKLMSSGSGQALAGGGTDPQKTTSACEWSIEDFDSLSDDPRALSAKALYLATFVTFGAEDRGTVSEPDIKALYARSAVRWQSPIPHYLVTQLGGLGSKTRLAGMRCIRGVGVQAPETLRACDAVDAEVREKIRELTMALVIDHDFSLARLQRAENYLSLAEGYYADQKPSRQLFEHAIEDFASIKGASLETMHTAYCDRAIAVASIGQYEESVSLYLKCMRYAKDGIEQSPLVYEQLAHVYMKLGKPTDAANVLTRGITNSTGGGLDAATVLGGMDAFRALYTEYDLVPDVIVAETIRRRFRPQSPETWDAGFIAAKRKITSSILPELYIMRGDAYLKAGRLAEAQADYRRVRSDAWEGSKPNLPRNLYFDDHGMRNLEAPEPWPTTPPKL